MATAIFFGDGAGRGPHVASLLSDGPLEPKRIVELGTQLAEALEAAHSRGVFHGDIKPENIVVANRTGARSCVRFRC